MKSKSQLLNDDGIQSGLQAGMLSGAMIGLFLGILALLDDISKGKLIADAVGFHIPLAIGVCSILLGFIGSVFGLIYSLIISGRLQNESKLCKRKVSIEWGGIWVAVGLTCLMAIISQSNVDPFPKVEFALFSSILAIILFFGGYIGGKIFKNRRLFSSKKV